MATHPPSTVGAIPRKQLPQIPIPTGGRIHGTPMSPVRVNIQSEDWLPVASSAEIVGTKEDTQLGLPDDQEGGQSQYQQSTNRQSPTIELPYRIPPPEPPRTSGENTSPKSSPDGSLHYGRAVPDAIDEDGDPADQPVPQLHYHHQSRPSQDSSVSAAPNHGLAPVNRHSNDIVDTGASINRHLSPNSTYARRTPVQRPMSAYSDSASRGRPASGFGSPSSPYHGRAPSAQSGRSHDGRPLSYVDLINVNYPQPPPVAMSFDNSQLRSAVGTNASLLSTQKTLEMYRQNVKKTNDVETQYAFAIFLVQAAQDAGLGHEEELSFRKPSPKPGHDGESSYSDASGSAPHDLLREARNILQRLADKSYPFAQYYLADGYASGLFNKGKEDYGTAFPLFVAASKHGHAESGYRAALCYEFGWGCRKDVAKAVQFYRQSASKNHPGAMTRLGRACLSGDLGLNRYREGIKWLKRATESADPQYNAAPYHLGVLYETGYGDDIFQDESYAAQLFTQAADLGHAEASYRLGDAYEHGKLSCPRDPALSVHFYTGAAQRGHPVAMMALCAWYMVGAEPVLEKDENEAYEWARQAAECGLVKAQYAVGYFTEMGIGCRRDPLEANVWYVKAADAGDERAIHRLGAIRAAASGGTPKEVGSPRSKTKSGKHTPETTKASGENDKECIVM